MIHDNATFGPPSGALAPVVVPPLSQPSSAGAASQATTVQPAAAPPTENKVKLCMVTPWKQECGNAEYAERLCVALERFSDVTPFDLRNFADDFELRSPARVREYFDGLLARINAQDADVVHIQHEFCFFGRSIQRSNREFLRFVKQVNKPIVITLHTWLESGNDKRKLKLKTVLKNPWQLFRSAAHRKHLYKSLCAASAIVVHTHDTYSMLVAAFPRLRERIHIVQIPIARVENVSAIPGLVKAPGDVWIMLPGFVSPYKGHQHAVDALETLPPNYKLVIAGGRHPKDRRAPRYWMELLTEVEEKGLQSRVLFTGFLPSSEQAAVLKQADIFLLPYDEVGQSGSAVLADALAYDRPVITSRARSMFAYRMSQDTVYCCTSTDVADPDVLAAEILKASRFEEADAEVRRHRTAAMARYSLAAIGSAYERLYKDVRSNGR